MTLGGTAAVLLLLVTDAVLLHPDPAAFTTEAETAPVGEFVLRRLELDVLRFMQN